MRRIARYAGCFLVLLIGIAFPYGPLFPWSPWKPGFDHVSLQHADLFVPTGTHPKPAYDQIDSYIAAAERFHRLKYEKRITVVATRDWTQFRRLLPHIRGNAVGAVTLATGTAIYVSPKLDEKNLDHAEFLRHELSHALIHQHQSLPNAFTFCKIEWLCEGIAVTFGDQKSYITQEEFLRRAPTTDLLPVFDPDRKPPNPDMRFAYVAWRNFIEFLIREKGRDVFQQFLEQTMQSPEAWRTIYAGTYHQPFEDTIQSFQNRTRNP